MNGFIVFRVVQKISSTQLITSPLHARFTSEINTPGFSGTFSRLLAKTNATRKRLKSQNQKASKQKAVRNRQIKGGGGGTSCSSSLYYLRHRKRIQTAAENIKSHRKVTCRINAGYSTSQGIVETFVILACLLRSLKKRDTVFSF